MAEKPTQEEGGLTEEQQKDAQAWKDIADGLGTNPGKGNEQKKDEETEQEERLRKSARP